MKQNIEDYLKDKCYEVLNAKDMYENDRKTFFDCTENLKTSIFWMGSIHEKAIEMQKSFRKYSDLNFYVQQICSASGNEWIYDSIVVNDKNDNKKNVLDIQLNAVSAYIREAAEKGKECAHYRLTLSEEAITKIKEMGYKIETKFTTTNELYYVISWGSDTE